MSWEYDIAEKIKASGQKAREKAVEEASGYIGTIEQLSPLQDFDYGRRSLLRRTGRNLPEPHLLRIWL